MPFVRIDIIEGHSEKAICDLMEAAHRALVMAFGIPERDRYQVVHEHRRSRVVFQDSGLGITRTDKVVVFTITTRSRSEEAKRVLFEELARRLKEACGIEPSDVIVTCITNTDADWSFGFGRAQFKTGEL